MRSKMDAAFEITEETWVVSLINTKTGFEGFIEGGHAALLIEGIESEKTYIRHCDITGQVVEGGFFSDSGYIGDIRIWEEYRYAGDYSQCSGWAYYLEPKKVKLMMESIKADEGRVKSNLPENRIPFEKIRLLSGNDIQAHNCMSWCKEKLAIAGLDVAGKDKPKKIDVTPACCCSLF